MLPSATVPKPSSEAIASICMTVDLINSHFPSFLITNWLPASISSLSRCISQHWGRPSHHQLNKRKSLSADLIAVRGGLCGTVPSSWVNTKWQAGLLYFSWGYWTGGRGVELWCGSLFTACKEIWVRGSPAADISAVMELSLLSKRRKKAVCRVASAHQMFSARTHLSCREGISTIFCFLKKKKKRFSLRGVRGHSLFRQ